MINMKVQISDAIMKELVNLPFAVQFKCIDPAVKKMAAPIIRATKGDYPDSSSPTGTQRWSKDNVPPQNKWSASARRKFDTGPSGKHVISKFMKSDRGGILYIGMQADGDQLGKKMHFRLPVLKKRRIVYYWGRPGQVITQRTRNATITYVRKATTQSKVAPGSTIELEKDHFLERALNRAYTSAVGIFETEFVKQAKELKLG
jgi:hypothetical protein